MLHHLLHTFLLALAAITLPAQAANPYLPVWLVAPRAWARPPVSTPRFDGSGRLLLQELNRLSGRGDRGGARP